MKLIQTKDYLLLIDEEAEIKRGDYLLEKESIINVFPDYLTDLDECVKIIAYYPLTKEAKELDLPLLPNPFEENIEVLWSDFNKNHNRNCPLSKEQFVRAINYKAAQSKQFSLEDMKKAIEMARKTFISDRRPIDRYSTEEIIQSLSTQQLPVSFEPEYKKQFIKYDEEVSSYKGDGFIANSDTLKTITNSEGKQELVGIYKY